MKKKKGSRCKKCGEPIKWVKTNNGNFIPVERKPCYFWELEGGAGRMIAGDGRKVDCTFSGKLTRETKIGYEPHFNYCVGLAQEKNEARRQEAQAGIEAARIRRIKQDEKDLKAQEKRERDNEVRRALERQVCFYD